VLDLADDEDDGWPVSLDRDAFVGVAGEFVRAVLPHTEADEAALLMHFLVATGCLVGRAWNFPVSGTAHHPRLFSVAVGGTASGRKGTALDVVLHVLSAADAANVADTFDDGLTDNTVDAGFCERNIDNGLTSGAGLIWRIRDPDDRPEASGAAVADKRLLVIEPEFGGVLRVCQRKENDLSAVIRDSWDGKTLRSMAKQQPAKATAPHVCVLGHVTREELRATLSSIDTANGFANRILWWAVRRSKLLPDGGQLHTVDLSELVTSIRTAVAFGQTGGRMSRSDAAGKLWHSEYGRLTERPPGILGQVTTRAEAQVLRLSMLYALLDGSNTIDVPHLLAALAVWKYCEDSARWAFGASLGNRTADTLLAALRHVQPDGLTRTDISDLFGRNARQTELRDACALLKRLGLADSQQIRTPGAGRPATVWFAR